MSLLTRTGVLITLVRCRITPGHPARPAKEAAALGEPEANYSLQVI